MGEDADPPSSAGGLPVGRRLRQPDVQRGTQLDRLLADAALRTRPATTALEEVRRLYSWPVLARSIDAVYAELAGTAPDLDWPMPAGVDLSCRFRSAAHLL